MSDSGLPKNLREAISYIIWPVLIVGLGGAGIEKFLNQQWASAAACLLVLIALAITDIYFLRPKSSASNVAIGRKRMNSWGPWILIAGGPIVGLLWLYVGRHQPNSVVVSQDRWTWSALTDSQIDTLYDQLHDKGQYSFYIACAQPQCSQLAASFEQLFKRLKWPCSVGDGGVLATGVEGILVNPGDDPAGRFLKKFLEADTSLRVELGPNRQAQITSPTMLIIGTKPAVLPNGPMEMEGLIWDDHLGHTYSSENGTIVTKAIQISAKNTSGREISLEDVYIVSGQTGEKISMLLGAGGSWIAPQDANLIPPDAVITLRADINPPVGMAARQFFNDWKTMSLISIYNGETHRKVIDEKMVAALYSNFRPSPLGPQVTLKSK